MTDFLAPLMRRPARYQVSALCYRFTADGTPEILLVTSRDTGRWILPKGWPKNGRSGGGTAIEEAWEEAGVKPAPRDPLKIGRYRYKKRLTGGLPVETVVDVYAIEVIRLFDEFPEMDERERHWKLPLDAAELVNEPDLKILLRNLPQLPSGPEAHSQAYPQDSTKPNGG
ncbi:NUDIX hydrolase [Pseudooceanicola sp. CBS1P-1]|uniref:NUDIX domain-containing protein n=2 Tax=Paracoccaceae TaxID=31989 RepID=A0A6L7FXY2_9RHOB|nr:MULTISPECIES: NUDIX hydrolase [Pseudooceanicola]MBT9382393.1 NUDIX hydrolase [Pseudooceanicola endophyticus]MXN16934.1 NUDIX domain-containing protein [Pseudooceanicola albus]